MLKVSVLITGACARIALAGRFDFSAHREFKEGYAPLLPATGVSELEIDLGKVEYLDSSSLGMLLLLRQQAENAGKTVRLTHCRGVVREVLDIANFSRMFTIT